MGEEKIPTMFCVSVIVRGAHAYTSRAQAHFVDQFRKLRARERFSECVCQHVLTRLVYHVDFSGFDFLADEVVLHVDMLRAGMVCRVFGQ